MFVEVFSKYLEGEGHGDTRHVTERIFVHCTRILWKPDLNIEISKGFPYVERHNVAAIVPR